MTFESPGMLRRRVCSINADVGPALHHVSVIVLDILLGTAVQRLYLLPGAGGASGTIATIGRSPTSTVVITDFHLSGDHAQITQIGDHFVFRDLRSTNGSAIDRAGQRVSVDAAARWEIALLDGDVILLGNPADPVRISVRLGESTDEDLGDRKVVAADDLSDQRVGGQPLASVLPIPFEILPEVLPELPGGLHFAFCQLLHEPGIELIRGTVAERVTR